MKLRVKLYGTFGRRLPGYRASQGLEVEIPPETLVKDLLTLLEIDENQGGVVVMDGRILKGNDPIPSGGEAQIFQAVRGG
jgi:sulfur carrier protein ThiS